jgi:putative CRISPR-associated protein (TIGR02620 family)
VTTYLVSRHPGAIVWLKDHLPPGVALESCVVVEHLDEQVLVAGDIVMGVIPLAWAAIACARGAHVLSLDVRLAASQRGQELESEELNRAGARLVAYDVRVVSPPALG